jgi:trk system potassium uptake protein TrkH
MSALARSLFPVLNVLGAVVVIFAITMFVPLAFAFFGKDAALPAYDNAIIITLLAGGALYLVTRRYKRELQPRDGFLLVTLVWTALPLFASLPFMFHRPTLAFTDAYFEAMSGITTTGATVFTNLQELPLSINVWRHFLSWMGGMGILVLAVAILPLLGVGGSQVFKAESAGPLKETKLTPRIAETAKGLYSIYFVLSAVCLLSYRMAGLSWADAFMLTCTTVSLGGFAPHDQSFAYWDSARVESVAIVFMLIAGINFSMHFLAWRRRSPAVYLRDAEGRSFLLVVLCAVLVVTAFLRLLDVYPDIPTSLRHAAFNVISIATTTGYASVDYYQWPVFAPVLMLFLCCFASCAGSTGGGIKMIRALLLVKQAKREFTRILHPRVINPVTLGGQPVENNVIFAVLAFMLIWGGSIIVITMLLLVSGLDVITAFSAAVATLTNLGPGLNQVGPATTYQGLNDFQTWVCTFAMLIGRLELFAVLVLFTPMFWRK